MSSIETRYGAVHLWAMNAHDPLVKGEDLNGQFSYHVLDTKGPPLVHVTGSSRSEVVLFGQDQRLLTPVALDAGPEITINSLDDERLSVCRFSVGQPDSKRIVSTRIDDVVRAIVDLGGSYPDVVQALQIAKSTGALTSRFAMDALPTGGRRHYRKNPAEAPAAEGEQTNESAVAVGTPMPGILGRRGQDDHPGSKIPVEKPKSTSDEKLSVYSRNRR